MTKEQYEALKVGDLVRHTGGKLYKVVGVHPAREAHTYPNGVTVPACVYHVNFRQWQVNEKFPLGRFFQPSRTFTADKVELVQG